MLATVLGLLTGKTKIKFSSIVAATSLLVFDQLKILQVPDSELGVWFKYGLFVGVWALFVSLSVDWFVFLVEDIRRKRREKRQKIEKEERMKESIVGSFRSLGNTDLIYLLDIYFDPSGTRFVDIKNEAINQPTPYRNLLDQGVLVNVGTSKTRPRVVVHDFVKDEIEKHSEEFSQFWESVCSDK